MLKSTELEIKKKIRILKTKPKKLEHSIQETLFGAEIFKSFNYKLNKGRDNCLEGKIFSQLSLALQIAQLSCLDIFS